MILSRRELLFGAASVALLPTALIPAYAPVFMLQTCTDGENWNTVSLAQAKDGLFYFDGFPLNTLAGSIPYRIRQVA